MFYFALVRRIALVGGIEVVGSLAIAICHVFVRIITIVGKRALRRILVSRTIANEMRLALDR